MLRLGDLVALRLDAPSVTGVAVHNGPAAELVLIDAINHPHHFASLQLFRVALISFEFSAVTVIACHSQRARDKSHRVEPRICRCTLQYLNVFECLACCLWLLAGKRRDHGYQAGTTQNQRGKNGPNPHLECEGKSCANRSMRFVTDGEPRGTSVHANGPAGKQSEAKEKPLFCCEGRFFESSAVSDRSVFRKHVYHVFAERKPAVVAGVEHVAPREFMD